MFGTIINSLTIIVCSLAGLLLKGGIPERCQITIMQAIGLSIVLIGLKEALGCDDLLILILSMVFGALLGEAIRVEDRLESLGKWIEARFASRKNGTGDSGSIARAFVAASLLFCVGSMAIVGSLESGLSGRHDILYAKSILDGVISIIFTSTMGIGVIFSAGAVFVYQGTITMAASLIKPYLIPEVVAQMSAVGGLLITAIGINVMEIKKIRLGNMLPAIFIPLVWHVAREVWK